MDNEKILEFNIIRKKWQELALTEGAVKQIEDEKMCMSKTELLSKQRETTEARILIEKNGTPPLVSLNGIEELVETAVKGGCLTPPQLEAVEAAMVAVLRLKTYLARGKQYDVSVAWYEENLFYPEEVREFIRMQIRNGQVDDNASPLLKRLKGDIDRVRDKMKEKADSAIRAHKECMSDSFSTFRNGHLCIPVKKEYKFKIGGSVIDKSATGNTLFIEITAVAALQDELGLLLIDAENEELRILYELSALVADNAEVIRQDIKMIERLDYIFSKGKLSLEYDGTEPEIVEERYICLVDGRHPLMDKETVVPLQFEIGNGIDGIVITGPNTGGKTVAIKTVALNCMMAQYGLHVACRKAKITMNSNILCDIGDNQNLSENLSTFSAHITNVLNILTVINKNSLVIMDELGSGTDPAEGMGIAVAVLEELKKSGALFLVTTHYPEVKQYADSREGIINARMTFDKENLKPLYRMVIGEAGESCAFYIAGKLGMPDEMIKNAIKAAYGEEAAGEYIPMGNVIHKETAPVLKKEKKRSSFQSRAKSFKLGDSVMVMPDKKIGIVCETANDKGVLRVQMPDKKIWINHKRVKLHVAAEELYPEDYDFSIIFDTVENRKLRHSMDRKYVADAVIETDEK